MAKERAGTKTKGRARKPGLNIRRVPIDSLQLDPANARFHGDRNMEAIAASLRRFGQAEPLIVQSGTGRVIGGNGRLAAMRELGWTECDVVEVDLEETEAAALGIALNRTAELAEWDELALAGLLEELRAEDALAGVGYSGEEIDALLAELAGEEDAELEDPGPEDLPKEPVTRPGDLWILGDHRLLCGDSTREEDVERVLAGEAAALLSTDPPYCIDYTGDSRPMKAGKDWSAVYREVDIPDLGKFLDAALDACLPHLDERAAIYLWHAHVKQPVVAKVLERKGILLHQIIVWVKPTATFGYSFFRWRHEPCAFGWQRGKKPPRLAGQIDTVWEVDWEGMARVVGNEHPIQKPVRLFEIPMEQHTRRGEVVLEPFCGSGSQLIAAEKFRRRCRAIEVQPAFVDVAVRRWQQATGRQAVLAETEEAFEVVAEERRGG